MAHARFAAALLLPLLWVEIAVADDVVTFQANGNFQNGQTLGGTLTIDTTTGAITGEALTVSGLPVFDYAVNDYAISSATRLVEFIGPDEVVPGIGFPNLTLLLPSSLVGYAGGQIAPTALGETPGLGSSFQQTFYSSVSTLSGSPVGNLLSGALSVAGRTDTGIYFAGNVAPLEPASPQSVVIGQQVMLTGVPEPDADGESHWSFDGSPVAGYSLKDCVANCAAMVTPVSAKTTSQSKTTVYWATPGLYTVTYTPTAGEKSTATFLVTGPQTADAGGNITVSLTTGTLNQEPPQPQSSGSVSVGCGYLGRRGCVDYDFHAPSVTGGKLRFLQTIPLDLQLGVPGGKPDLVYDILDTCFPLPIARTPPATNPYPCNQGDFCFVDVPDSDVTHDFGFYRLFEAKLYLMWQSSLPNSIYVPIGSASWGFQLEGYNSGGLWQFTGPLTHPVAQLFHAETEFPTFSTSVSTLTGVPPCVDPTRRQPPSE